MGVFSLLLLSQLYRIAYALPTEHKFWINGVEVTDPAVLEEFFQRYPQFKPSGWTGFGRTTTTEAANQTVTPEPPQLNQSTLLTKAYVSTAEESPVVEGAITLSASVKAFVLEEHNNYRRMIANGQVPNMPSATMMNELIWSDAIGTKASEHASKCVMAHTPSGRYCGIDGYDNIGENLASSTAVLNDLSSDEQIKAAFKEAIKGWFDEYADYDFHTMACTKQCGHFTQMVRDSTERLGCGIAMCENGITNFISGRAGYIIVCNYGPGNNFSNKPAYETGEDKECPPVRPIRKDGLCTGEGRRGPENCEDQTSHCSVWEQEGKCALCNNPYYQWMSEVCPKTCGIC